MTLEDRFQLLHPFDEALLEARVLEEDLDERTDLRADSGGIHHRGPALDDAGRLELLDALVDGGGREPDPLADLGLRERSVPLDECQDAAVELVEFSNACACACRGSILAAA